MRALTFTVTLTLLSAAGLPAQARLNLPTTPERTNYEETSKYEDVMAFLRAVDRASPLITLDSMGKTVEGRTMPLVIVGTNLNGTSPEAVKATGKLRVYLQGNIHAGEVEGKETLQILLREIAEGQHRAWLDSLVLLINPIYNADGNERFNVRNRGRQHGPVKGMGVRPNAQNFDLNRDHMKVESPEARALVSVIDRYDPAVGVDLHTTNGTQHAYYLTYSPPLHPNTAEPIIALLRQRWLPELTTNVRDQHGWDFYYYGNMNTRGPKPGWYTFEHVARFNNNYLGIRNRFGILSEAYSYATFKDRIAATTYFVKEVLGYAYKHASEIRRTVEQLDRQSIVGQRMATRADFDPEGTPATILMGEVIREVNPHSGDTIWRRADVKMPTETREYGTFTGTDTEIVPRAYFLPPAAAAKVGTVLNVHGIRARPLQRDSTINGQRFRIDSTFVAERPFQNHRQRTLVGAYEDASITLPAGTLVIDMNQPLARLIFLQLEARSDDGVVNWNVLDPDIEKERYYPIVRALR